MLVIETITFPQNIKDISLESLFQLITIKNTYSHIIMIKFRNLIIIRNLLAYLKEHPSSKLCDLNLETIITQIYTICKEKGNHYNPKFDEFKQHLILRLNRHNISTHYEVLQIFKILFYITESIQLIERIQ
jgi:hypothetical protein